MPIYEYECTPCLIIYEVRQGMKDPPLATCPKCSGSVSRVISAPNLNRYNFSSPTEAKYAKVSPQEEIVKTLEAFRSRQKAVFVTDDIPRFPFDAVFCKDVQSTYTVTRESPEFCR